MEAIGENNMFDFYEKLTKIETIEDALQDEESKIIFRARINYMMDKNEDAYLKVIENLNKKWYCLELDKKLKTIDIKGIIIFGSGHDGLWTKKILNYCNYFPQFFCDSDERKVGKSVCGLKIISTEELLSNYKNFLVVIGSRRYAMEMCHFLLTRKFPTENILCPMYNNMLIAQCGKQYFDVFEPKENEVFIDGGAFDGKTSFDFIKWSKGRCAKIYAFEPNPKMLDLLRKKIEREQVTRIELYPNALWNKKKTLYFQENRSASRIEENGKMCVEAVSLDEVVKSEKVTFIKLDIEGSELKALEGAANIIKRDKPRLAISIYHKYEDVLELSLYILQLLPEYKLYIRHYDLDMGETVLYAI